MALKFYNTLGRKKEVFKPIKDKTVGLYTCGPTVYEYAHLGHARTYIFADLLKRALLYNGYKIRHVMNITDVGQLTGADVSDEGEDKIEMAAKREKKTVWDIAQFYTDDFFKMTDELNILRPTIVCKATDHIKEQIKLIKRIEKNGYTYVIKRGVCFDTSKFADYADFARLDLKGMKKGARIEFDSQKKNPTDFWLWRFSDPKEKRQMEWDSPWGRGFPGWHIECSAMSMKYLEEKFDIHTGGIDHIPVHHTNEIAQNWAATGHKVVNFWLHGEFLLIERRKMAKSLKNFYRVADLKNQGFKALALRYLFLTSHYRSKMNFTWRALGASQNALESLYDKVRELKSTIPSFRRSSKKGYNETRKRYQKKFLSFINDDLNVPNVLALMWKLLRDEKVSPREKYELLLEFDSVFGLDLDKVKEIKIPKKIQKLVWLREKYRKAKNFKKADQIRKEVQKLGFKIEDTDKGPKIKKVL